MPGWWKAPFGYTLTQVLRLGARLAGNDTRALVAPERKVLEPIFQGSVALDAVRICVLAEGLLAVPDLGGVLESTIFLPQRFFPMPMTTLVHEVCHVWQYQHGGCAFVGDSISARLFGDGYRFEKGILEGREWHALNSEQQATLIEEAWVRGCFDGKPFVVNGRDHSAYLERALAELRAGRGASFR